MRFVIESLMDGEWEHFVPAVRVVGNLCAQDSSEHIENFVKADGIPVLAEILKNSKKESDLMEVSWAISNIASEPSRYVGLLLDAGVIESLCHIVLSSPFAKVCTTIMEATRIGKTGGRLRAGKCVRGGYGAPDIQDD